MRIIYLDQNKWIELARAAKRPAEYLEQHAILEAVERDVSSGRAVLPLSATNIYETYKINDPQRRGELASLQSALSGGLVFRGRHARLEKELSELLRDACGLPPKPREPNWFLSNIFFEAVAELNDSRVKLSIPDEAIDAIRNSPGAALYDYIMAGSAEHRALGVKLFSEGSEQLRQQIEKRRSQSKDESMSMRRKIYSATLLIDEIDLVLEIAKKAGVPWTTVSEIGQTNARRIVEDVPIYYSERELALRLEAQNRPIDENDFRDMQSFCAVAPYADIVIAENQFVNLAKQAGLDKKYDTRIVTSIVELRDSLLRPQGGQSEACAPARCIRLDR